VPASFKDFQRYFLKFLEVFENGSSRRKKAIASALLPKGLPSQTKKKKSNENEEVQG